MAFVSLFGWQLSYNSSGGKISDIASCFHFFIVFAIDLLRLMEVEYSRGTNCASVAT